MTKDSVGNKLAEGQYVQVAIPSGVSLLRGRVKAISEPRITRIGGTHNGGKMVSEEPGLITVEILIPVESDPRTGVAPNLTRIWDPSGKDLEAAKTESEKTA